MNRKELADMAYEATVVSHVDAFYPMTIEALEHFANLVAKKEREACAQLCEPKSKRPCDCESCYCQNSGDLADVTSWDDATRLAKAIRARGQK